MFAGAARPRSRGILTFFSFFLFLSAMSLYPWRLGESGSIGIWS